MTRFMTCAFAVLLLTACTTKPLSIRQPATVNNAGRVCDLTLIPGTDVYVELKGGATARGRLHRLSCEVLELVPPTTRRVVIKTDDIALVGRVKGRSSTARGWIGAAIGAALVAPFGISMIGDMALPGAIVGGIIGHNTGNSHVEVVFTRISPTAGRRVPAIPLPTQ